MYESEFARDFAVGFFFSFSPHPNPLSLSPLTGSFISELAVPPDGRNHTLHRQLAAAQRHSRPHTGLKAPLRTPSSLVQVCGWGRKGCSASGSQGVCLYPRCVCSRLFKSNDMQHRLNSE